jgi:hypothetical protein
MANPRYSLVNNVTEKTMEKSKIKFNSDKRLLLLSEGHNLELRLVNFQDSMSLRTEPWVTKFIHTVYTKEADDSFTAHFTLCPSTKYLGITNWRERCLCCKEAEDLYQYLNSHSLNKNSKELFVKAAKTTKRKFKMFLPVFVISDNLNPQNNNTLKILLFNDMKILFRISNYFEKFLRAGDTESYLKHFNNFGNTNCLNLIVNVSPKNVFDIQFKFSAAKNILIDNFDDPTVSAQFMEKSISDLNFDTDFVDQFDDDKHKEFFDTFIKPALVRVNQIRTSNQVIAQHDDDEQPLIGPPAEFLEMSAQQVVNDTDKALTQEEIAIIKSKSVPAIEIPKDVLAALPQPTVKEIKLKPEPTIVDVEQNEASVLSSEMLEIINSIEDFQRE